jgi:hypothetical protein
VGSGLRDEEVVEAGARVRRRLLRTVSRRTSIPDSSPSVLLLAASVFSGIMSVAVPVHLDASGLSKLAIVAFFIASALIVVGYSLGIVPRLARLGYPAAPLRVTTAVVPFGTLFILYGADHVVLLALGAVMMLATTTSVPQVFGRVAALYEQDPGAVVFRLRRTMVLGYVLGLGVYSVASFARIEPLLVGSMFATISAILAWSPYFSRHVDLPRRNQEASAAVRTRPRATALLAGAIAVVAMMKGVDTLRAMYLPLFATGAGVPNDAIAPLFIVTAVTEVVLLPHLRRITGRFGEFRTLGVICAVATGAFVMLFAIRGYGTLLASQFIYAAFAAGLQSIGVVLLARVTGRDIGQGAAIFMTVMQSGSVLGVVLPLVVPGYQSGIFAIAAALCLVCTGVCLALRRVDRQ